MARVTSAVVLLAAVVTGLLIAFAWPATRSSVHDVPLGVAGPGADAAAQALATRQPGAFEVRRYADDAAARTAVREREVYGALVTGADGTVVLTASAAAPTVAQALGQLATGLAQESGRPVRVEDVVPTPADDPRGAGLAAAALPIVLGGILAAGLLTRFVPRRWPRIAAALAFSVVAGAAIAAVLRYWIGALDGPYVLLAGVLALGVAATSVALLGLESLLGFAGLGLGAVTMVALGNPLSGASSAPELLPAGWGTLGQVLPPGAEITLLRSVAFFDGGGGRTLLVLCCWLTAGLLFTALASARPSARTPEPATAAHPVPVA